MNINIADNLKRLRRERNLTQEELAERVGVSGQAVSKWETAAGLPDLPLLISLASFFGVSLDDLVGMNELKSRERLDASEMSRGRSGSPAAVSHFETA